MEKKSNERVGVSKNWCDETRLGKERNTQSGGDERFQRLVLGKKVE